MLPVQWNVLDLYIVPKWRNWQTRVVQVHVLARVWGFESLLRHQSFKISSLERIARSVLLFMTSNWNQALASKPTYPYVQYSAADKNSPPKDIFSAEALVRNKIAKRVPVVGTGGR